MRLESVSYRYHRRAAWVLRDVNLSLTPGQVTEVTGRNGAGKSTFLRLVAGLRPPRQGTITGRPDKVGYAPERFPTDQPFTVRAYLTHMAAMQKAPRTAITTWAERLAFDHLLDTRLPELSKGSAQKVGLAQALLTSPDLLILDEPFAGLDATTRDLLPTLIAERAADGTTVVVSDHQRCLAPLSGVTRVHIADTTVKPHTATARPHPPDTREPKPATPTASDPRPSAPRATDLRQDDRPPHHPSEEPGEPSTPGPSTPDGGWSVVEVIVRSEEVDKVVGKLRADGLTVREPER